MAGFFSLSGGGDNAPSSPGDRQPPPPPPPLQQQIPPETWFWSRSHHPHQGFELWQQQHHHTMGPGGFVIRHDQEEQDLQYGSSSRAAPYPGDGEIRRAAVVGGGGGICCQDCGNQAKKDCPYLRCRTCCKSRGLECQTHVKSTWVPAAKRRERQQQVSAAAVNHRPAPTAQFRSSAGEASKRSRTPPESPMDTNTNTGLEFPAELSSAALFRCVRVSSGGDDSEDQYAYQTAVKIGGHVFRGILYDCGPEPPNYGSTARRDSSSSSGAGAGGGLQPLITVASHAVADTFGSSGGGVATTSAYEHSTSASLYMAATAPISRNYSTHNTFN